MSHTDKSMIVERLDLDENADKSLSLLEKSLVFIST